MANDLRARLPDYSVVQPPQPLRTTVVPPPDEVKGDAFWSEDVKILFARDRLLEILPDKSMTWEEKLNALVRFTSYAAALVYALNRDPKFLVFGVLTVAALTLMYRDSAVQDDTRPYARFRRDNAAPVKQVPCRTSTPDNPFANFLPTDPPHRPQACPSTDPEQAALTRRHFDAGFPRDIDPVQQDASFAHFDSRLNEGPLRDVAGFAEFCGNDWF